MTTYKLQKDPILNEVQSVLFVEEGMHIPFCRSNKDYQAYLAWLAEGNEPLPADATD